MNTPEGKATSTAEAATAAVEALFTATVEPTTPPTTAPTSAPVLSPEDALEHAITEKLGSSNREVPRVDYFNITYPDGTTNILIQWALNDNLTDNLRKIGARLDAVYILEVIDNSGFENLRVHLQGTFSMVDEYGNASEKVILKLFYTQETLDKINWENFLSENIYKIADNADVHPELLP